MKGIELIATGRGTPGRLVTNDNLAQFVDTNDAWIRERTGISSAVIALRMKEGWI